MPKRDNFELAFFTLSDPIWIGDLGTEVKKVVVAFGPTYMLIMFF